MEKLFPRISKLFKDRGKSFDDFHQKMNTSGIHDICLLFTFREFEENLKAKEKYPDFKHFESLFYNKARSYQQIFPEIIQGYVPLIMKDFESNIFKRLFKLLSKKEKEEKWPVE